jgi:ABC-type phosphate/phosphonate transport system substrate-binding protein
MRLPTKLLLMTLAGLLLIPFSARAELVLGACPQPTSLLKSVPQAQRLAAYLEHRLEESVAVRIFFAEEELRTALVSGAVVDLAVLTDAGAEAEKGVRVLARPTPRAEVSAAGTLVARADLEDARVQRLAEVLAGMEQDEGGRALLYDLGLQSLSATASGATPPRSAPSVSSRTVPARSGLPASGEGKALVLGALAADVAQAEAFARDLGQRLGRPVRVRSFPAEDELLQWVGRYRMIDLAFLPESAARQALSAQVLRLARSTEPAGRQFPAESLLVARPGLSPRQLSAVRQALVGDPVVQRSAPSRPAMRKPAPISAPVSRSSAVREGRAAGRVASSLTLGSVPGVLFRDEGQAREFARLLGNRLGVPVKARSFPDQQTLQQWLGRHRMIDIGVLDAAFLRRQPAGSALPLLPAGAFGGGEVSLVARQGLSSATLQRLRDGLNQLVDDPDVERLLGGGAVSPPPPSTVARPASPPSRVAVPAPAPPPVVAAPPAPAPRPVPVRPAPVPPAPVVKTPPPPPAPPVVRAEPVPPPPAPAPQPESEPKVTKKTAEPELRLSFPGERDEVYLVPFTTVMVPDAVVETIFDRFVEAMSAEGLAEQYNFIILKGGLDSVDSDWRRDHDYVTGEVFGYVEESGCCSTDIRTKSRVAFHRAGRETPTLRHEYPVKTFFDHDYSTIDKERRKLAELIADELAAKVRAALGGS